MLLLRRRGKLSRLYRAVLYSTLLTPWMTVKMTLNAYTSCIFTNCLVAVIFGVFKEQYLKLQKLILTFSANQTPLQRHCAEIRNKYSQKWNCAALFLHSCICERFIYLHHRSTYFAADTWMWKLGTRTRSFIPGSTYIGSFLQCIHF